MDEQDREEGMDCVLWFSPFLASRAGLTSHARVQARKGDIDINELTLPTQLESERAYAEFQQHWDDACKAGNPKLARVLWKAFGKVNAAVFHIYCSSSGTTW